MKLLPPQAHSANLIYNHKNKTDWQSPVRFCLHSLKLSYAAKGLLL